MTDQDVKRNIETALKSFSSGSFSKNALALFGALGYNTSRQNPFVHKIAAEFEDNFGHAFAEKNFNKEKARFDEWKTVDLLFQLSREELSGQQGLFDSHKINWEGEDERTVIETYLFFAIELSLPEYSRTLLAQITREVNKIFPMPVMIIFRHGQTLTLSIIDRRLHKRAVQKDVLKKVTLIKDISIGSPHRAHLEILFDLSLDELRRVQKFTNFVELHNAWQKTLDTKELNKRFYRELANWYFWAVKNVSFPNDVDNDKDDTVFNSESVIRMLTRLIFIWFIKEKHLIPENIFDEKELRGMVKNFNTTGSTVYYRAVLQNLFFATLNKKIEERAFATDGTFEQNKKNYGIKNLYRYSSDFNISKEAVMKMFAGVPFLNGGLFDCLDFEDEKGKVLYLDGFSRNSKKQAMVPDKLFFAREHTIDLSAVYDDKKKKNEKVKGLFEIFNRYKFTITENTPIEEEIALDPELLGRVFENLLASYNPETQTTARKQTGSFYTPREIVNYMVDESLKAYLKQNLETEAKMKPHDADAGLEILFTYTEKEHAFTGKETKTLIYAIDNCKILDPACGSGAFPMGILHKLVHILHKLDPQNEKWKERQITKAKQIDDPAIREQAIVDIEAAFTNNELDYGRKLYLIENCIYGVDIQPVATQISKLRFFISLIVDQKVNKTRDNFGIRPLPNLETKFVAANTLIGLDKPQIGGQAKLKNLEIEALENELKNLRHQYFNARTRTEKRTCQKKDQELREKISTLLAKENDWDKASSKQVAAFNPYDQNASSPFFDPEWMFGVTDGFDVVIGNPPYIKEDVFRGAFDGVRYHQCYQGKMDIWYLFAAIAIDIIRDNGILCFIATNNWISNDGASKFRNKINREATIDSYIDFGNFKVFLAGIQTMVFIVRKNNNKDSYKLKYTKVINEFINHDSVMEMLSHNKECNNSEYIKFGFSYDRKAFANKYISFTNSNIDFVIDKIIRSSTATLDKDEIFSGIDVMQDCVSKSHISFIDSEKKVGDGIFVLNHSEYSGNKWNKEELDIIKPYYTTREINRYYADVKNNYWILYTSAKVNKEKAKYPNIKKHLDQFQNVITSVNKPYGLHRTRDENIFIDEKIFSVRKCEQPSFSYVNFPCYVARTFLIIKTKRFNLKYLVSLFNSKIVAFLLWNRGKLQGNNYQIDKEPLMIIPIINAKNYVSSFITFHDFCVMSFSHQSYRIFFENLINAMVYELYFPEEIKAADAEVLKHLTGLPELKDDWSDKKKLETIEKVYSELSNGKHPVSIAMARQKTIPEIRIIEGLDK